jgi:hypothetical protein
MKMKNLKLKSPKKKKKHDEEKEEKKVEAESARAISSDDASEGKKKEARNNLRKIGRILTWQGQGRPKKYNETAILLKYENYVSRLTPFLKRCQEHHLTQHRRKKVLIEEFPELANYPSVFRHREAKAMTVALLKEMYGIEKQNLIKLLKKA